jgi:asparagine synthase (glutamine-hydrolysing)
MYSNIEHVLVRSGRLSPLDGLDRTFFLFDRPMLNLCNWVWTRAISHAARERNLSILLSGQMGNVSVSYTGIELLPELLRAGRVVKLLREAAKLVALGQVRWRGVLAQSLGPFTPAWLWNSANTTLRGRGSDRFKHTAIRAERLAELNRHALAGQRPLDVLHRPWKDGFAARVWGMRRVEVGNFNKGLLAGWGLDQRDPTADRRLVEYCLSVPTEQYCTNGVTRALAKGALVDRLPQAVLSERKKGYQAVDWHEGLTAGRDGIAAELDRFALFTPAANVLDIKRLRDLVQNWPTSGWERDDVIQPYRRVLLRGISAGHFLRMAAGANQ